MPLSERARVEVYVPDLPFPPYQDLLVALEVEFAYNFGGCTVQRGLRGNYQSQAGHPIQDRINVVYTDTPYSLAQNLSLLSRFANELRSRAAEGLEEEAILVTVAPIYHAE